MPIYEFYCRKCNTIYNFFSRSVNTDKIPSCPRCKNVKLARRMSLFSAITGKTKDGEEADPFRGMDESKMGKAMMQLAAEAEGIREDDPRAAANLMRKLSDATGMKLGDGFQEALRRLEAGEDPDKIDEEMGDLLSAEDPFGENRRGRKSAARKPRKDETLYDL
ncbi:MAG TPA: zinc ribbon domain-containing protein [Smithellaceae bacterium]|nr:zinc ribbon domain-containing protein [Smithellaceae bacterium]HQJ77771.1 zinc ribbon domain-containing protein [Smithellaceae bacterium]